jgi:hypothetical protein
MTQVRYDDGEEDDFAFDDPDVFLDHDGLGVST